MKTYPNDYYTHEYLVINLDDPSLADIITNSNNDLDGYLNICASIVVNELKSNACANFKVIITEVHKRLYDDVKKTLWVKIQALMTHKG